MRHRPGRGAHDALDALAVDPAVLKLYGSDKPLDVHGVIWSPDETRLLLTSEAPSRFKPCGDLFLFELSSQRLTQLTHSDSSQYHPKFSPDGKSIEAFLQRKGVPVVRPTASLGLSASDKQMVSSISTGE